MYKLVVTKLEENENYESEMENMKNNFGYSRMNDSFPVRNVEKTYLAVMIEDKEWETIKKEVIKVS